ncbi:MAG: hypothetical protein ABJB01_02810 [Rudaea sp.]
MTTLEDVERRSNETARGKIHGAFLLAPYKGLSYTQFIELVEQGLLYSTAQIWANPKFYVELNEDQITHYICSALDCLGFDASFNSFQGGHCDVTVKIAFGYVWLGEAKIDHDYEWLNKGYHQLTTRYSTGQVNQNNGGMLIYCKKPRIDTIMEKWKIRLEEGAPGVTLTDWPESASAFYSVAKHERTGADFRVLHLPISIYFNPKDKAKGDVAVQAAQ